MKYLLFARKCLASASKLDHSLMSSGGVSGVDSLIFPLRQQNPGGSNSNFFALHSRQFSTGSNIWVSSGILAYNASYGSDTSGIEPESSSASWSGTSSSVPLSKVEYLSSNVLDIFSDAIKASWNLSSYRNISTLSCKAVSFKLLVVLLEYHVLIAIILGAIILGCELGTQVNEMDDVMCERNNNINLRK